MRRIFLYSFIVTVFSCPVISCHTPYQTESMQYKSYRITGNEMKDTAILSMLDPYSVNVSKTMNDVVGIADRNLEKKQPECTLGNFMVDAFFTMAKEKYNTNVDACFMNYGGIRLTQLPAGNITTGKIFELMPFDNLLILQKVKGTALQQLLDITAAKGGWPLAGVTMQIRNNKAVNVMIGGKPIDPEAVYTVANSDFVANGGDNADMLRTVPQIANGYLMRDALFDYIKKLKSEGRNVNAQIENRVTNAQ